MRDHTLAMNVTKSSSPPVNSQNTSEFIAVEGGRSTARGVPRSSPQAGLSRITLAFIMRSLKSVVNARRVRPIRAPFDDMSVFIPVKNHTAALSILPSLLRVALTRRPSGGSIAARKLQNQHELEKSVRIDRIKPHEIFAA